MQQKELFFILLFFVLDCKQRRDAVVAVFVAVVVVVVVDVVVAVALALLVIVVAAAAANSTPDIQVVIRLKTIYQGKFTQSLTSFELAQ